ncbi:MAG: hypothetical protein OQK46_05920 [Gammaproteobacteria bacterium]|nr:hypothetical protein [Gammaproteobacteria bacterium]
MKKIKLLLVSVLTLASSHVLSATISVGPYLLETDAAATSASFTGSVFENVSGAMSDNQVNTYIKGTSVDAAVSLGFDNISLSNQDGNDLALFFLTANNTVSINLNGTTQAYNSNQLFVNPDDPFVDIGEKYLVNNVALSDGTSGFFDLSVIFVDLDTFGIGLNDSLNNITIDIGNGTSFLNYAIGLNETVVTAVPVPAAFILFLSGLTGLGLLSRRKR